MQNIVVSAPDRTPAHDRALVAVLFLVGVTAGLQFQAVGAVLPMIVSDLGIDGLHGGALIGAFLLPGIAVSIRFDALSRIGERPTLLAAVALMSGGAAAGALTETFEGAVALRIVAGSGAALATIVMLQMLSTRFDGGALSVRIGVLASAWPTGIALGLLTSAPLAQAASWPVAGLAGAGAGAVCVLLVAWRVRSAAPPPRSVRSIPLDRAERRSLAAAGFVSMMFGAVWAVVHGFGTTYLAQRGLNAPEAGLLLCLVAGSAAIAIPIGAALAANSQHPVAFCTACCAITAALLIPIAASEAFFVVGLLLVGAVAAAPVGVVSTIPAQVLPASGRAVAIRIFCACQFAGIACGPPLAGWAVDRSGDPATALWLCAVLCVLALPALACLGHPSTPRLAVTRAPGIIGARR